MSQTRRVLLVDDDDNLREALTIVLEEQGFHVIPAASGTRALAHCIESRFDLLITDLNMPEMDGIQLVGIVHKLQPRMGVIVITSHPLQWTPWSQRLRSYGLDEEVVKFERMKYLNKPFKQSELLALIGQFFKSDTEERTEGNATSLETPSQE